VVRYQVDGVPPGPKGNRHPTITPFQAFLAKDDYIAIPVGNNAMWKIFCTAIEREDLIEHERFATNQLRTENIQELIPILDGVMKTKTVAEWVEVFKKVNFPCSPINTIDKAMELPQVMARNMIVDVDDKDIGHVKIAGNPIKMSSLPEEPVRASSPDIGENNDDILKTWLGYSDDAIERLRQDGVI
jgi:CoA:oxalate CoA-transferase